MNKDKFISFLIGIIIGAVIAASAGLLYHSYLNDPQQFKSKIKTILHYRKLLKIQWPTFRKPIAENFTEQIQAQSGKIFGKNNQLVFELYRGGTFVIDGKSGYAWEKSDHYGDVAIIRSAKALPKTNQDEFSGKAPPNRQNTANHAGKRGG